MYLCVYNLSSASVLYGTYALQSIRHCEDFSLHSGDAEDITGMIIRGAFSTPIQVQEEFEFEDIINPETSETTHQRQCHFPEHYNKIQGLSEHNLLHTEVLCSYMFRSCTRIIITLAKKQ